MASHHHYWVHRIITCRDATDSLREYSIGRVAHAARAGCARPMTVTPHLTVGTCRWAPAGGCRCCEGRHLRRSNPCHGREMAHLHCICGGVCPASPGRQVSHNPLAVTNHRQKQQSATTNLCRGPTSTYMSSGGSVKVHLPATVTPAEAGVQRVSSGCPARVPGFPLSRE